MKTTLTVEINYNPKKTDPEGLACAMDRLMETALSTPEILDEYGNPKVGEFFVLKAARARQARGSPADGPEVYALRIGGSLLRAQMRLVMTLTGEKTGIDKEVLEGILSLLEGIADQAYDRYGIDCLLNARIKADKD